MGNRHQYQLTVRMYDGSQSYWRGDSLDRGLDFGESRWQNPDVKSMTLKDVKNQIVIKEWKP